MLGQHQLLTLGSHQQLLNVSKIITHADYDDPTSANDVALVKLATPAVPGRYVNMACLSSVLLPTNHPCYITGFGATLSESMLQHSSVKREEKDSDQLASIPSLAQQSTGVKRRKLMHVS